MKHRIELVAGLFSLSSLIIAVVSLSNGWAWGAVVGLSVWCILLPVSPILYFGRALSAAINEVHDVAHYRDVQVPQVAKDAADKLGITPPKNTKVMPNLGFNAKVNTQFLFVTEGLLSALWTPMAKGIMAHEMAHLARKHERQRTIVFCTLGVVVFLFIGTVLAEFSASFVLLAMLLMGMTVWPVVWTKVRHHQEFDADRQAAKIVGVNTMTHTLRSIEDRSLWEMDSDTHPSTRKRLSRLEKTRLACSR